MSTTVKYTDYLKTVLKDPKRAAGYLNAALETGDLATFTLALRDVVDALGEGVGSTASKSNLNRESLYRMLSKNGNPRLSSLSSLMNSLGLEVHIVAKTASKSKNISAD
ncbi:MAG: transcriptional regulator [Alphaproteobacteria bacterium]